MLPKRLILFLFLYLIFTTNNFSQTGPGGVGNSSNNVLWFKADKGTNTTTDGANVSSWLDQSGNGYDVSQATSNRQPLYRTNVINGFPTIQFDNITATNDRLVGSDYPLLDNTSGLSFFTITRPLNLDNSTARSIISKRTGVGIQQSYMIFYFNGGDKIHTDIQSTNNRFSTNTTFLNSTNYMVDMIYDGTLAAANRAKVYVNGALDVTSTETNSFIPDNVSPLILGATNETDGRPFGGHMAEIIQYRVALNDAQRNIVNNYLSAKYDIAISNDRYVGDDVANGNYDFEVAGIGKESTGASNDSVSFEVTSGLAIKVNSGFDNTDYCLFGHKVAQNDIDSIDVTGIGGSNPARWKRIWYFDVTNTSTALTINLTFDISAGGQGIATTDIASNYKLIFRASDSGAWTEVATASYIDGDQIYFSNFAITDGYYTISSQDYPDSPLPIQLAYFNGKTYNDSIQLNWATYSEINNNVFEIYKSPDGKIFEKLKNIDGAGYSNQFLKYQIYDRTPFNGNNIYKLKQIDFDGKYEEFEPINVWFEKDLDAKVYPNPIKKGELLMIELENENYISEIIWLNLKGSKVSVSSFTQSEQKIQLKIPEDIIGGYYFIQLKSPHQSKTFKVLINN